MSSLNCFPSVHLSPDTMMFKFRTSLRGYRYFMMFIKLTMTHISTCTVLAIPLQFPGTHPANSPGSRLFLLRWPQTQFFGDN